MSIPKRSAVVHLATVLTLLSGGPSLFAADAPAATPGTIPVANAPELPAPASGAPVAPATPGQPGAQAAGARRGGGARGGRGGAMAPEDQAAIAKLSTLPPWKPGLGEGDYMMVPNVGKTPAYDPAPENAPRDNVPKGKVVSFSMPLAESKFYPGIRGSSTMRDVAVYIPAGYVPGTPAPMILCNDAMGWKDNKPAPYLPDILDNMIADRRLPAMVAVMLMHGGGDGPGSERGLEYDTVSGKYAEFVEAEVLPRITKDYNVTFSKDPDARATMGGSSGGAAAFSMAWFHPELYHRVLLFSGTFVGQKRDPATAPHGAWEFHENFIPKTTPIKPLRVWLEVAQNDNGAGGAASGMGNWIIANLRMAAAFKTMGYHYQFVFAPQAGHVDRPVRSQTLAPALEWLWKDYKPSGK